MSPRTPVLGNGAEILKHRRGILVVFAVYDGGYRLSEPTRARTLVRGIARLTVFSSEDGQRLIQCSVLKCVVRRY